MTTERSCWMSSRMVILSCNSIRQAQFVVNLGRRQVDFYRSGVWHMYLLVVIQFPTFGPQQEYPDHGHVGYNGHARVWMTRTSEFRTQNFAEAPIKLRGPGCSRPAGPTIGQLLGKRARFPPRSTLPRSRATH
jgi:hypothetical protein